MTFFLSLYLSALGLEVLFAVYRLFEFEAVQGCHSSHQESCLSVTRHLRAKFTRCISITISDRYACNFPAAQRDSRCVYLYILLFSLSRFIFINFLLALSMVPKEGCFFFHFSS
ncbi:hypothetical protein IF2G_08873 [Cordyceps javanica]|nr:hypothetical protein IF2G_08873 [Cordyceps javanica]